MHRRTRAARLLVATAAAVLAGGNSAQAGGGTWVFEDQGLNRTAVFTPGDHVEAFTSLGLKGVIPGDKKGAYWGGPQHGPYFGYITPRSGPDRRQIAPPVPDQALVVGEVVFRQSKRPDVLDVSLDFVMPDLAPGYYTLHHCNDPCTRQIGDTMSTPIMVVEDQGQALLAGRVQRLEWRDAAFRFRFEDRTEDLQKRNARIEMEIEALRNRVKELESRPVEALARPQGSGTWTVLAWGVAAVLLLLTVVLLGDVGPRFRRRRAFTHPG